MPKSSPERFDCPDCGAQYKLVRVEADAEQDRQITCCRCGAPLNGREGAFALKYFLVGRPQARVRLAIQGRSDHAEVAGPL